MRKKLDRRPDVALLKETISSVDGQKIIEEGPVKICFPDPNEIFYNPVQKYNRDLSVLFLKAWQEEYSLYKTKRDISKLNNRIANESCPPSDSSCSNLESNNVSPAPKVEEEVPDLSSEPYKSINIRILDALSATGLRALRYAKEVPNVERVVANDLSANACKSIAINVKNNNLEHLIEPKQSNAVVALYESLENRYHVIDLDPFGSACALIDPAIQVISEEGLLMVTCTDMAVLAGPHRSACWSKYGGLTVPDTPYHQEMAIRLVLNALQTSALRYKRTIEPLCSVSADFYVRVAVRIRNASKSLRAPAGNTSMVYHCTQCKSFDIQPLWKTPHDSPKNGSPAQVLDSASKCPFCDGVRHIGGPFYSSPIHNKDFVKRVLRIAQNENYDTKPRLLGMLNLILKECDVPLYWSITSLTNVMHINQPPMKVLASALLNSKYNVSLTHCSPNCLKTNAPGSFIWDVMKAWEEKHPVSKEKHSKNSPGSIILSKPATSSVNMSFNKKFNKIANKNPNEKSYQINPTKNWGPMPRPGKRKRSEVKDSNSAPISR